MAEVFCQGVVSFVFRICNLLKHLCKLNNFCSSIIAVYNLIAIWEFNGHGNIFSRKLLEIHQVP